VADNKAEVGDRDERGYSCFIVNKDVLVTGDFSEGELSRRKYSRKS
jgi:hypothetical protein